MASFKREEALVKHLLARLDLDGATTENPNLGGNETGVDVAVRLPDCRSIGVQVTEIDPHLIPGSARAREKKIAKTSPEKPYFMWAQNDPAVVLDAIARAITRKAGIAATHSFDGYDEVWLLICGGIPEHGSVVSTSVMTPWLSQGDLNSATDSLLKTSKYDRCFFLPILASEQAFYPWDRASRWEKHVKPEDISQIPRQVYVDSMMKAGAAGIGKRWTAFSKRNVGSF
jgi:hypothetical protein